MDKKTGLNIVFFVFIAILFSIISCSHPAPKADPEVLFKADRDFSALSARAGMHEAFLTYVADSGVLLRDDAYPLVGKESLASLFSGRPDTTFTLTWEPVRGIISSSGDLGYTYGYYTRVVKATGEKGRGTYLTIWQKQKDGSWKFVLDTGTDGLPDESK
ncbi:MAG: DUF4440 domain-containing protein [Bacteroidales bacterium]